MNFTFKLARKKRKKKEFSNAETIEKNLIILGATAVEDKLQEDVAATIEYIIKVTIQL